MNRIINLNEITADQMVSLIGYTVNRVEDDGDRTTVYYTKTITGAIIGIEVMFDDDGIYMSQEYLVDTRVEL